MQKQLSPEQQYELDCKIFDRLLYHFEQIISLFVAQTFSLCPEGLQP